MAEVLKDVLFEFSVDVQINVIDISNSYLIPTEVIEGFYFSPHAEMKDFLELIPYMDYEVKMVYTSYLPIERHPKVVDILISNTTYCTDFSGLQDSGE